MNSGLVRRGTTFALFGLALTTLTACEDKRVRDLDTGITRDSAITALAQGARDASRPDSMPNIAHKERYFLGGKTYEVLFFSEDNKKGGRDTLDFKELTPIVMIDNIVVGKGWDYLDSLSKANNIPLKQRD